MASKARSVISLNHERAPRSSSSEPEQFIAAGDRILVFVHARRLPKDSDTWRERDLADVYTFRDGRVMSMRAFGNREDALRWVGIEERPK